MYRFILRDFSKQTYPCLCKIRFLIFISKQVSLQVTWVIGWYAINQPCMRRCNKITVFIAINYLLYKFFNRLGILIELDGILVKLDSIFPCKRFVISEEGVVLHNVSFCFLVVTSDYSFIRPLKQVTLAVGKQFNALVIIFRI